MLEVKNIKKKFENLVAVNNISFSLSQGKILGLLGKNGAGKSTIFRIILNILEPDMGAVYLDNVKYTIRESRKIGFLPEEGSLSPELTVYEQVCFYASLKGMDNDQALYALIEWLKKFEILEYLNKKIKELSKGNRQRIQFICAVIHNPEIIILDEPFSGLDPLGVESFKKILSDLKKENKAIIFSSHRMEHVEVLCDEILLIDKGNLKYYGDLTKMKEEYPRIKIITKTGQNIRGRIIDKVDAQKILKENPGVKTETLSLNDIFIDMVGDQNE